MIYKKYIIDKGRVTFEYPANWESSIEDNNTYLFYDKMLGSFRITPTVIEGDSFNLKKILTGELDDNKNSNAKWKKIGNRDFVYYEELSKNELDNSKLHYFISGDKNTLLVCSYAYDRSLIGDNRINEELKKVEHILESISFLNP